MIAFPPNHHHRIAAFHNSNPPNKDVKNAAAACERNAALATPGGFFVTPTGLLLLDGVWIGELVIVGVLMSATVKLTLAKDVPANAVVSKVKTLDGVAREIALCASAASALGSIATYARTTDGVSSCLAEESRLLHPGVDAVHSTGAGVGPPIIAPTTPMHKGCCDKLLASWQVGAFSVTLPVIFFVLAGNEVVVIVTVVTMVAVVVVSVAVVAAPMAMTVLVTASSIVVSSAPSVVVSAPTSFTVTKHNNVRHLLIACMLSTCAAQRNPSSNL